MRVSVSLLFYIAGIIPFLLFFGMKLEPFVCGLVAFGSALFTTGRIDTHFHALPPPYVDTLEEAGGDPSGYPTPIWSLEASVKSMDAIGTSIGTFTF